MNKLLKKTQDLFKNFFRERKVVLNDWSDGKNNIHEEIVLLPNGDIEFRGHDTGPHVEEMWGADEYEWVTTIQARHVKKLRKKMGGDNILLTLKEKYVTDSPSTTLDFVLNLEVPTTFWNRVGG